MSAGQLSPRHSHKSSKSQSSKVSDRALAQPPVTQPVDSEDAAFAPCSATGSFFLHAQKNVISCLHHDTLALERRFDKHEHDVFLVAADNVSERSSGCRIVTCDVGQNAYIWEVFTGEQVSRFSSFEPIRVATWMKDGRIAFGNARGSIIIFDPDTSEHESDRTIYDPVTALAPASDCRTFAIGYQNGSILIATLQPFNILHTLNTTNAPSPISGLAWHGSSHKQKTEMLATQTSDGDLRVWSVSKLPENEPPRVIRILRGAESYGKRYWFAWSKNGRLVQHSGGGTQAWDVRTKKIAHVSVPTIDDVVGITNYGPTATLFTLGPLNTVQQYDLNPQGTPTMVAQTQHAPVNAPPTPPDSIPRETPPPIEPPSIETTSSEDEGTALSPFDKITREMVQLEEERRDQVTPLSPISSRASMSSASSYGRRNRQRAKDRLPTRASDVESEGTIFSGTSSGRTGGQDSMSIRSQSTSQSRHRQSSLRQEMLRSPEESGSKTSDLFPYAKARLTEVKFRPSQPEGDTNDALRKEMLSVVFGWDNDIQSLIRDEQARHRQGSASAILLSKWLGDFGADALASMVGSQSLTSADWMILALSSQMGEGSQKHLGETFVRRLLEQDEIHAAVAILLGLGQENEAVEAYVSRTYFMEALLLTCLRFPNDWHRQSFLLRRWGEAAVNTKEPELAVRCFSCTTMESSESWFSPRAQDATYAAQQQQLSATSPPLSPPSAGLPNRLKEKNASLKLITDFGDKAAAKPQTSQLGVTPIIDSAASPGGLHSYKRSGSRGLRDPSSARTATPGGYRKRDPSAGMSARTEAEYTPMADTSRPGSRPGSRLSDKSHPGTAVKTRRAASDSIPSPAPGAFPNSHNAHRSSREGSRDRNPHGLQLTMTKTVETEEGASSRPSSSNAHHNRNRLSRGTSASQRTDDMSPLLTDGSNRSASRRKIDGYINSLDEANYQAQQLRARSRSRNASRSRSRPGQQESDVTYIKPSKRSPSSPVPMTSDDARRAAEGESFDRAQQGLSSPVDSRSGRAPRASSRSAKSRARSGSARRQESPEGRGGARSRSRNHGGRAASRPRSPDDAGSYQEIRGRDHNRTNSGARSPSSPSPMEVYDTPAHGHVRHPRDGRQPVDVSGRRTTSPSRGMRGISSSRRAVPEPASAIDRYPDEFLEEEIARCKSSNSMSRSRDLSRKALAAKELEERRLSLARRPSVPTIPHPGELNVGRPNLSPRSATEGSVAGTGQSINDFGRERSRTVDPESLRHGNNKVSGTSTSSVPIGLPATPRAMRHPRYMGSGSEDHNGVPAVPAVPQQYQQQAEQESDGLGPLLPSSVYGQKGGAPPRSASAPPEQSAPPQSSLPQRPRRGSTKNSSSPSQEKPSAPGSGPEITARIDETMNDNNNNSNNIIVVQEPEEPPPMLPELMHLATPPPPPPPPPPGPPSHSPSNTGSGSGGSSGVINIGIDSAHQSRTNTPAEPQQAPQPSTSPNMQRRGRGSIGGGPGETLSSKWRNVKDRMRSDSRNRTKSPQETFTISPYETVLPQTQFESMTVSGASAAGDSGGVERHSPPRRPSNQGYRNPKDVRAAYANNDQLQPGVYQPPPVEGGMI
ncbi:MAG: hypothetical protein M1831_003570 [Alyxoria varia]|nr:MAG: hypothetical protein M1831_003570 [Alyxoria varia]